MNYAGSTGNEMKKHKQMPPAFLVAIVVFILGAAAGPLPR